MGKTICSLLLTFYFSLLAGIYGCGSLPRIVIAHDPLNAEEHADLASVYEENGEFDIAIKEGEEALKYDPKNLKAIMALGNSHLVKKEYYKAEKYYKKALKIEPGNGDILNNMAILYMETGKLEDAEKLAAKAISSDSSHLGYFYDTLGRVYEKTGKEKEAREAFDKSRELLNVSK